MNLDSKRFFALHLGNLIITSIVALPATFVSKTSPALIDQLSKEQRAADSIGNYNKTLAENSQDAFTHSNETGLSFFYSGKPALTKITNSPAFLTSMDAFVQTDRLFNHILGKPVAWLSQRDIGIADTVRLTDFPMDCVYTFPENTGHTKYGPCDAIDGQVNVTKAAPGSFVIKVNSNMAGRLNLTQAYHHRWIASVNGRRVPVKKTNISFMSVEIQKGVSDIVFRYDPGVIPFAFLLSLLTVFLIIVFLIIGRLKRTARATVHTS